MTEKLSHGNRGLDRRTLLRGGLLVGAGTTVAGLTAQSFPGVAQAAANRTLMKPYPPLRDQPDWWWCSRCDGIFFSANGTAHGICWKAYPSFGPHDPAGSVMYRIPNGNPGYPGLQVGWRWCSACQLLFWGPGQAKSACPAVSWRADMFGPYTHVITNNTVYDLWMGGPGRFLQVSWRCCNLCQGLFYGPRMVDSACAYGPERQHSWGNTSEYGYSLFYG